MMVVSIRALRGTLLAALLAIGCGGAQPPANARTTVISINQLDCSGCGEELAGKLAKEKDVYKTGFDKRRAELPVVAAPSVDVLSTAKRHQGDEEYELVLGAGKGRYIELPKPPEGTDVQTVVKDGADVPALEAHLVKGKVTVMEFGAIWCEPCRKIDEHMIELLGKRSDLAYRKLDVGDWDTPLAQRYLKNVPNLPLVVVFAKSGQKVDSISGLDLARLDAAIDKGSR